MNMMASSKIYKVVNDDRKAVLIPHWRICYPKAIHQQLVDDAETKYPGIVIDFENGYYLIEDGVHRMTKLQQNGHFESWFYVVTRQEYQLGMVDMIVGEERVTLGKWNHNALDTRPHPSYSNEVENYLTNGPH